MITVPTLLNEYGIMLDANTKPIESSIVPIFRFMLGARPEFIASAVYCNLGSEHFLLTAKHVAVAKSEEFIIPSSHQDFDSIPVDGGYTYSTSDEIDVAVARLSRPLTAFTPLAANQIINVDQARKIPNQMIALGFPGSTVKATSTNARTLLKKFASNEETFSEYLRLKVDSRIAVLLEFDKTSVVSLARGNITFPNPNGMSGGGLFWIHRSGLFYKRPALLIGILTEWNYKQKRGMRATKINYILAMIHSKYGTDIPQIFLNGISVTSSGVSQRDTTAS